LAENCSRQVIFFVLLPLLTVDDFAEIVVPTDNFVCLVVAAPLMPLEMT
jgi:hypothetical protein